MKQNEKGLNILICGSQKFDDESFVFGMMDSIYKAYHKKIDTIYTSKFSGSCQFVSNWVATLNESIPDNESKIKLADCTFDMHLSKENISLYEDYDLPAFIYENDPFFQQGKEMLLKSNVNLILAFPNKEGILGASTKNIRRFAELANLNKSFFDCSKAYEKLNYIKQQELINDEPKVDNKQEGVSPFANRRKSI